MQRPIVAVTAQSFLKNDVLCRELQERLPQAHIRFAKTDDVSSASALRFFLSQANAWIVGREPVSQDVIFGLTGLKLIAKYGVGLDNVDLELCDRLGIKVATKPGVNALQVAELTLGLMLSALRNIAYTSRLLREGQWHKMGGVDLCGRTVGIVGCGHIGTRVLRLVRAFDCPALICDITDKRSLAESFGARQVSFEDLYQTADIVTAHVPLTPWTARMFNRSVFERMKPGSVFINTARGELVVEEDLQAALVTGPLRAAASDVFQVEPPQDDRLVGLDNFVGTPHIGGASLEAMLAMGRAAIEAVAQYLG